MVGLAKYIQIRMHSPPLKKMALLLLGEDQLKEEIVIVSVVF